MSSTLESQGPLVVSATVSFARLHGRACWYCGTVSKPLTAAGQIRLQGGVRVWDIKACGCLTASASTQ
ncbi:hypothetical protein [Streptomyces fagopyri]|uniref:hypothetical protein n=1 Tax=Streptomyces fagopyri TaxID=2662397 RepID=UPI003809EE68